MMGWKAFEAREMGLRLQIFAQRLNSSGTVVALGGVGYAVC